MAEPFTVLYDLSDPEQATQARRHAGYWGRLYTQVEDVAQHRVALTFSPAPNRRWAGWEDVRRQWILSDCTRGQLMRAVEGDE